MNHTHLTLHDAGPPAPGSDRGFTHLRTGGGPVATAHCRAGCGACCIAPSISSAIPGMRHGKAAGVTCVQLDAQKRCRLFGQAERPAVCRSLRPSAAMCGDHPGQAMSWLGQLELLTTPDSPNAQ